MFIQDTVNDCTSHMGQQLKDPMQVGGVIQGHANNLRFPLVYERKHTFIIMHPHLLPTPQLFSELCNKGRLAASWGLGSRGRSSLHPHCSHTATVGVQRVTAGATTRGPSPYVVFVEGGGSSVRDAKEHAAALAAEQLLRSLCHSGGSVEAVWGNILSRSPGAMQQYGRRLASNLQVAAGQPLPPAHLTGPPAAGPALYGAPPSVGTPYYPPGPQQLYDQQQWHQQQQPQMLLPLPLHRKGPEPWQQQVRLVPAASERGRGLYQ